MAGRYTSMHSGPGMWGEFLVRHVHVVHPARAGLMVTALRGFLRWVHLQGAVDADLAATVPAVAYWRFAAVPKSIPAGDVEHLLRRCRQRNSEAGLRDQAVLMLMARLGLRGGEVVGLDWQTSTGALAPCGSTARAGGRTFSRCRPNR